MARASTEEITMSMVREEVNIDQAEVEIAVKHFDEHREADEAARQVSHFFNF